jgi:TonB family protein
MKFVIAAVVVAWGIGAGTAAAQDIEKIRTLYVAAAYEDALAAMPAPDAASTEVERFRALCLLALGREDDARAAIERLVKGSPMFRPSEEDMSPKMRTLFSSVRAALIPDIARSTYADAKKAFEAKQDAEATAGFKRTIELIDSLPDESRGPLDDVRLLAAEFSDLTAARAPKPEPPPATKPPEAPAAAAVPFVPAVAVEERLPAWNPPDVTTARTEFVGIIRIEIGADGRVTNATIAEPSHPSYDVAVLQAAKRWVYKPATRAGQPIPSQKDIRIRLVPR